MVIKDYWGETTDPDINQFLDNNIYDVSLTSKVNFIVKSLCWQKKVYGLYGINIIAGIEKFPFKIRYDMIDDKGCIVLDYGCMKDYIRPFRNAFIGVCTIRGRKFLWFMLNKSNHLHNNDLNHVPMSAVL